MKPSKWEMKNGICKGKHKCKHLQTRTLKKGKKEETQTPKQIKHRIEREKERKSWAHNKILRMFGCMTTRNDDHRCVEEDGSSSNLKRTQYISMASCTRPTPSTKTKESHKAKLQLDQRA